MAPLAKNHHDNIEACLQTSVMTASPASVWSRAAPVMMVPRVSLTTSVSGSSQSTAYGASSSSGVSCGNKASLTVLHNVGGAFRALLLVLQRNGVARSSISEMQGMILSERYMEAMQRAEDYVDCLLAVATLDLDSIILLFTNAWEALCDYSRTVFREAQKEYTRWDNQHWVEFIESTSMSQYDQDRRKRRQLENLDPEQHQELKARLFLATRFKIDCEKGLIQTTEWSRYLRAQQRR